jgi:hypothetical protein
MERRGVEMEYRDSGPTKLLLKSVAIKMTRRVLTSEI